jgi:hypothetical protein
MSGLRGEGVAAVISGAGPSVLALTRPELASAICAHVPRPLAVPGDLDRQRRGNHPVTSLGMNGTPELLTISDRIRAHLVLI